MKRIRNRIKRYDDCYGELSRVLSSHTSLAELEDEQLGELYAAVSRTQRKLDVTTDTRKQAEYFKRLARLCDEIAGVKRCDGDVVRKQLNAEHEKRVRLFSRIRAILEEIPDAENGNLGQSRSLVARTTSRQPGAPPRWFLSSRTHLPSAERTWATPIRSKPSAITSPQVGQIYLAYWAPEARHYAVLILPFGFFDSIGLPGSIASTRLLQWERRPCHTRHPDTGAYAWSHGFETGQPRELEREFPVIWFSDMAFPARAQYSWIEARNLSVFCMEKTPLPYRHTILDFIHQRNTHGVVTDLNHPPANGVLAVPAIRETGPLSAEIDAYFDNVVFVPSSDDDPDFEMADGLPIKCEGLW